MSFFTFIILLLKFLHIFRLLLDILVFELVFLCLQKIAFLWLNNAELSTAAELDGKMLNFRKTFSMT